MDDVVLLSRIQFALTIMFHYLFPPLTIGMGVVMVYLEGMYLKTGEKIYENAARFWTRIFGLNFAIGVATGIVMEFQFGTNWATYSRFVGDVFGSALAAEGIFAFFLESGFLAVLIFGWDRVGPRMHFTSTVLVSLGSIFSSVWIVIANSWQQTPAGHHIVQMTKDGQPWFINGEPVMRAEIVDFWALVFNPSTMHRLVHVWIGCFILGAFFIMSISAWYIIKNRHLDFAKRSFKGALIFGLLASVAAPISGHFQAKSVYEHQPAKLAAFEGHFNTGPGDLSIFGIPDAEAGKTHYNLAIPGGLSFLLHEDFDSEVIGMDKFAPEDQPPVAIPFATYHLMVTLGVFFIALTVAGTFFLWRGTLFNKRWLMWTFVIAVIGPFIANEAGWVAAEVGRQPWSVQAPLKTNEAGQYITNDAGHFIYEESEGLRTENAVSPAIRANQVLGSIIGFSLIYALLFAVWLFILDRKIRTGPAPVEAEHPTPRRGAGFLDAASELPSHHDSLTESHDHSQRSDS